MEELCSLDAIVSRVLIGEVFNLVEHFSEWFSQYNKLLITDEGDVAVAKAFLGPIRLPTDLLDICEEKLKEKLKELKDGLQKADHFRRWVRKEIYSFDSTTGIVLSLLRQPGASVVRQDFVAKLQAGLLRGIPWLPCQMLGGHSAEFDAVIATLRGHAEPVKCVAWNHTKDTIASAGDDNDIIIWDAGTGMQVLKLKGHTSSVKSVLWSPKGDQLASGSLDKTVIIWDAKTGEKVQTLKGRTGF